MPTEADPVIYSSLRCLCAPLRRGEHPGSVDKPQVVPRPYLRELLRSHPRRGRGRELATNSKIVGDVHDEAVGVLSDIIGSEGYRFGR